MPTNLQSTAIPNYLPTISHHYINRPYIPLISHHIICLPFSTRFLKYSFSARCRSCLTVPRYVTTIIKIRSWSKFYVLTQQGIVPGILYQVAGMEFALADWAFVATKQQHVSPIKNSIRIAPPPILQLQHRINLKTSVYPPLLDWRGLISTLLKVWYAETTISLWALQLYMIFVDSLGKWNVRVTILRSDTGSKIYLLSTHSSMHL